MSRNLGPRRPAIVGFPAMFLAAATLSAQTSLVTNGSFETTLPTSSFRLFNSNTTDLPGWATFGSQNDITCVVFPGTATTDACGANIFPMVKLWPGPNNDFPDESPDGGNAIGMDGDFPSTLAQMIDGLVVGRSYTVSFWQLAAQPNTPEFGPGFFFGDTTERWDVSLGLEHHLSTQMFNDSHGYVPWQHQTLTFTVTDPQSSPGQVTSQLLGFFAVGTPSGVPPLVGLDGVVLLATPEPATCAMLGIGLAGVLLARRQRRRRAGPSSARRPDA
jgi:hypothetical protein